MALTTYAWERLIRQGGGNPKSIEKVLEPLHPGDGHEVLYLTVDGDPETAYVSGPESGSPVVLIAVGW